LESAEISGLFAHGFTGIGRTVELLDQIVETGGFSCYNTLYTIATDGQFDENVESAQV